MTRTFAAALAVTLIPWTASAQVIFRGGVDLVNFGVTVVDRKGNLVTDLTREDFELYEDGKKQEIAQFARGDASDALPPLRLGLLYDTSGSMEEDIKFARAAAIKFLNLLPHAQDITVVDFDTEVRSTTFGQGDFARLVERLRARKPDGWTALYDAFGVYLDVASGQEGRRILVVYTDGGDTRSAMNFSDMLNLIKASDVTVYPVGLLEHQRTSDRMEQQMRLQQIADATGGQAFFPTSVKELDANYARVIAEISSQYNLGFVSTDPRANGAWRKVELKLVRPDLKGAKIRSRKGYYAPSRPSSLH